MLKKISGCSVYSDQEWINEGSLSFDQGKIVAVGRSADQSGDEVLHFPSDYKCIPGMIDMHIHGANGSDTMDATHEALSTIAAALPKEATTSFLATTITQSDEAIEAALINAAEVIGHQKAGEAEIIGLHLEGPFISSEKAGAQPEKYIVPADIEKFDRWQEQSNHNIKEVTLAPEIEGGLELIHHLAKEHVVASIGHSNGVDEDVIKAIGAGATQVTHLYNGMRGMHHREPGVLGGALLHHNLYTELICDGKHVCQGMVNLAYKLKGSDRIILITDALRAKCLKDGVYDLGGQNVRVKDGLATLASGTIAGSVLKMNQAIKNILAFTDATLDDVIQMGAINPALQCNVFDRKGSLEIGKDADFVILDENNDLVMTVCRGKVAYERAGVGFN
ncbi:N-acetylglucosamine-6-phosphate deacetylase [Sporolactobacillus sp. Y61]|uniref:N-acetylglucosamine-6-phosphate deacetylase n=1 Tax=Sporolactobacillus sp. Y61 TaxID=3160863 RepID=A0AAU8ID18_9BACL|nr:N-acetylglucosamine-6-phosphate deacetylase [Sporolactobacillus sp. THM19-2]RYL92213.1 N-acetylglucosamine-6-phosphate deacetylase [Sporolactobacillus sp. THM19-2]